MRQLIAGAIDIGGTNTRVGLVDASGKVISCDKLLTPTGRGGADACVGSIREKLAKQCAASEIELPQLAGIGVVCAGPLDCATGVIDNPYTLPGWENHNIVASLSNLCSLPVWLEHDVNGALIGEVFLNGWLGQRVLMVSFGTGIGVAVFDGDRPFRAGARYQPEMGHIVVDALADNQCYCRHGGCFESAWSGTALGKLSQRMGFDSFDVLFQRWQAGDRALDDEMKRLSKLFMAGIWNLMAIFKPGILVLGGGLMSSYYPFCEQLIRQDLQGLDDFVESFRIVPASQGDGSTIVGASRLVFK